MSQKSILVVWRGIKRHKMISSLIAVFLAAAAAVSLMTSGSAGRSYQTAPAFSLGSISHSGQRVSLSQYAGKPVIINFWASWCEPCQKESPLLAHLYEQHNGRVIVLGLDENDTEASALAFAKTAGMGYPIASDPNTAVAGTYDVSALPQTFFLNARHQIVDHVIGGVSTASLSRGLSLMTSSP